MKRLSWFLSFIGFLALLVAVIAIIVWVRSPLGPALILDVPADISAGRVSASRPEAIVAARPPLQAQKTCGDTGLMRLLVVGRASPMTANAYGADAVRLVVVDFDTPRAAVLALPVRIWVDSSALTDPSLPQAELRMIYQNAWETAHGQPDAVRTQKATQVLAQAVVDIFAFVPDHYVTVEEAAFIEFIDLVGPIEVNLTSAVDGTSEGYGVYTSGLNLLNGQRTLDLTRLAHPGGQAVVDTWGSLARQDAVLQGMLMAALNLENAADFPEMVKSLRKAITTDLSVDQALDLACMVQEVGETVRMEVIGPELVSSDSAGHMVPKLTEIQQLIASMERGD